MALEELQRLLARLYTDTEFRDRFFADPAAIGREMGVSAEAAMQTAQTSQSQITYFANALKSKRLNEVEKLLPLTSRAMGHCFRSLFRTFADGYLPCGIKKHRDDALAYADYLVSQAGSADLPLWIIELARYEQLLLESAAPTFRGRICRFRVVIPPLIRSLMEQAVEPCAVLGSTFVVVYRLARNGPLHRVEICRPFRNAIPHRSATPGRIDHAENDRNETGQRNCPEGLCMERQVE